MKLGVNVDHVATIRQARHTCYPSPLEAGKLAMHAGADSITIHVREDRRHIQESDLKDFMDLGVRVNLEMAATQDMLHMALCYKPQDVCIVPEKREELTTEGGLDVVRHFEAVQQISFRLQSEGIRVSLFIEADLEQIEAAKALAPVVELHTGTYADAKRGASQQKELARLEQAVIAAHQMGLVVHAGHGLHYNNVQEIAAIPHIQELNIGHAIVARALMVGFEQAVADMRQAIDSACK